MPAAFAVLAVAGLVYDAAHAGFWRPAHDTAPIAAVLIVGLVGLLLRRSRFAWWVFVLVGAAGLLGWLIHAATHGASASLVVGALVGAVELGLLLSPPMRRFVRFRGRLTPKPRVSLTYSRD